jgi:gliding motility-associated-like protein
LAKKTRYIGKVIEFTLLCLFFMPVFGKGQSSPCIAGGELLYEYTKDNARPYTYDFVLKLYRDCRCVDREPPPEIPDAVTINIYKKDAPYSYSTHKVLQYVLRKESEFIEAINTNPCVLSTPPVCYRVDLFRGQVNLHPSEYGYTIAYQTKCCRLRTLNLSAVSGITCYTEIPGNKELPGAFENNSATFLSPEKNVVCSGKFFSMDFKATDADGDSLVYSLCKAYNGKSGFAPSQMELPPFTPAEYAFPYSETEPLGIKINFDSKTGNLSGIAPRQGDYSLAFCVAEYRQGIKINEHRKDIHLMIANCEWVADARIPSPVINCTGLKVQFTNNSKGELLTHYWDFGDNSTANDISREASPSYTYPEPGIYFARYIVNRGFNCADSQIVEVRVFPGFKPDFEVSRFCNQLPTEFKDISATMHGKVNSWRWDFGEPTSGGDISFFKNAFYKYPTTGPKSVTLIVSTTVGCRDTIEKEITIYDKPPLQLTDDTTICNSDTIQLNAIGTGYFRWWPDVAISNPNIPNPLVAPVRSSRYYVELKDWEGCINKDSIFVLVKDSVTLFAGNDTTICLSDTIRLNPSSDALQYKWQPPAFISNTESKNPFANPAGNIIYTLTATIGKCTQQDDIEIRVVPYPAIQVSNDTTICFGESVNLLVSGGVRYQWRPGAYINSTSVPNPFVQPTATTNYIVSVYDTKGCPKPSVDTVSIIVVPKVIVHAGNDTSIVVNQPLRLNAVANATFFSWSPSTGLDSPFNPAPIAYLSNDINYILKASTIEGCTGYDTVKVRVFKTSPDFFVPNAFTPNNDGINDIIRPVPAGIRSMEYFMIYNRYGQLVFSTSKVEQGWDGKINGHPQAAGLYAWKLLGRDYTGKVITKTGTLVLIR